MIYQKFDDAAHGWLRVPVAHLKSLKIASDISNYSYVSPNGLDAYLEEDQDLTVFIVAYTHNYGVAPTINHNYAGLDRSRIRDYPMYR